MYFFFIAQVGAEIGTVSLFSFSLFPLIFNSLCWVYRVEHAEPSLTAVAVISILGLIFFYLDLHSGKKENNRTYFFINFLCHFCAINLFASAFFCFFDGEKNSPFSFSSICFTFAWRLLYKSRRG